MRPETPNTSPSLPDLPDDRVMVGFICNGDHGEGRSVYVSAGIPIILLSEAPAVAREFALFAARDGLKPPDGKRCEHELLAISPRSAVDPRCCAFCGRPFTVGHKERCQIGLVFGPIEAPPDVVDRMIAQGLRVPLFDGETLNPDEEHENEATFASVKKDFETSLHKSSDIGRGAAFGGLALAWIVNGSGPRLGMDLLLPCGVLVFGLMIDGIEHFVGARAMRALASSVPEVRRNIGVHRFKEDLARAIRNDWHMFTARMSIYAVGIAWLLGVVVYRWMQ